MFHLIHKRLQLCRILYSGLALHSAADIDGVWVDGPDRRPDVFRGECQGDAMEELPDKGVPQVDIALVHVHFHVAQTAPPKEGEGFPAERILEQKLVPLSPQLLEVEAAFVVSQDDPCFGDLVEKPVNAFCKLFCPFEEKTPARTDMQEVFFAESEFFPEPGQFFKRDRNIHLHVSKTSTTAEH